MVGIECDHRGSRRLQEYTPYPINNTFFGSADGDGAALMDWVVSELKPHIDRNYRTWSQRAATGIGGSSMGGLMAMYAVVHHNNVFSKAACLSPSIMICTDQLSDELFNNDIDPDTKIYWSFGGRELTPENRVVAERTLQDFQEMLEYRGGEGMVRIVESGKHDEMSWRRQNPDYYDFLWLKPRTMPEKAD